jgi:hypothetical protein
MNKHASIVAMCECCNLFPKLCNTLCNYWIHLCTVEILSHLFCQQQTLTTDKMFKIRKIISLLTTLTAMIFFIALIGCNKESSTTPPAGNPVLSIKMVDAPSGYDAVNVEVIGLEANLGNGWTALALDNSGVYNLLSFTNGNSLALLNDTVFAPCTISELRLMLGTNNTVVVDGNMYDLTTPSGQTSGYKIKMAPQQLIAGGVYHLVLDFNTAKSVHETGNGKYMLKPVVTGYLQTSVGSIAGTISPFAGAWYVEATNAADTSGTYINQANGQFLISLVFPGNYTVKFYPNAGHAEKIIPGVAVVAGQTTQVGTIVIE